MTNDSKRTALIDKARRATDTLSLAAHAANSRRDDAEFLRGHIKYSIGPIRAALAVFEKAHTPTDDERTLFEAISDRLGDHSQSRNYEIADSGEYETMLCGPINVEVLAEWLMPTVTDARRPVQGEPTTGKLDWPNHWTTNDKLRDLHARWHDQPGNLIERCEWEGCEFWEAAKFTLRLSGVRVIGREPQDGPSDTLPNHCPECGSWGTEPDHPHLRGCSKPGHGKPANVSDVSDRLHSPGEMKAQGEPTAARVLAALNAYDPRAATDDLADYSPEHVADMRAALRAAFAVQEGERR